MKNPLWKTRLVTRRFDTQHGVPRGGEKKKEKKKLENVPPETDAHRQNNKSCTREKEYERDEKRRNN